MRRSLVAIVSSFHIRARAPNGVVGKKIEKQRMYLLAGSDVRELGCCAHTLLSIASAMVCVARGTSNVNLYTVRKCRLTSMGMSYCSG